MPSEFALHAIDVAVARSSSENLTRAKKTEKSKQQKSQNAKRLGSPIPTCFYSRKIGFIKIIVNEQNTSKKYLALDQWYVFDLFFQEMPLHRPIAKLQKYDR
jgi:hypothetical protein